MPQLPAKALVPEIEDEDEDDSEDAINEFDFLGSGEDGEGSPDPRRCAGEGAHHELGEWRVFWQEGHTAACSCFLPQGLHRMDILPERRGAEGEQEVRATVARPAPLPWKIPLGAQAGRVLPDVGLPALCVRVSSSCGPRGGNRMGPAGEAVRASMCCIFLRSWDSEQRGPRGHNMAGDQGFCQGGPWRVPAQSPLSIPTPL